MACLDSPRHLPHILSAGTPRSGCGLAGAAVVFVLPALTIPPGTYNVTDGYPCTQATLNARLAAAAGTALGPLGDPRWGHRGILFGHSRRITDTTFSDLTGWQPQVSGAAETMASITDGTLSEEHR
jgi:hypothetical protein